MQVEVDVLIPARAGSRGLPGKNMLPLGDRSLFLHSVACAQRVQGVRHVLVSTDDPILAEEAVRCGAYVPELRPRELATDLTPMADVIRYACDLLQREEGSAAECLLLLDPTSPLRDPQHINEAMDDLLRSPEPDGFVSVSIPAFNPLWVGVVLGDDGRLVRHPMTQQVFTRRQDVPKYWRINGSFYCWRSAFARAIQPDWLDRGVFIGVETPEILSHSIDEFGDLEVVRALLSSQAVVLPWMESPDV